MAKNLKILVVEDMKENIRAAKSYFSKLENIEVDYVTSYVEAVNALEDKTYAGVITDNYLPQIPGFDPQPHGLEIGKIATKYKVPWVVLTSSYDLHADSVVCKIACSDGDVSELIDLETIRTTKTDPAAWEKAFAVLCELSNGLDGLAELYEAKLRFEKFTGKRYFGR